MLVYWLLFAFFACGALLEAEPRTTRKAPLLLMIGAVLLALLIGFRYRVGADWVTYQGMYDFVGHAALGRVLALEDPGYQLLNWLAQRAGLQVWAVNLVCGAIFAWGLFRFCSNQPLPWLAFVVAIPYLGIVVAMGYSRQGVAIGIILAGLASVERGATALRFTAYVALAALFHRTAVVVIPLVVFSGQRTRALNFIVAIAMSILIYDLLLARSLGRLFQNYLGSEMSSQGAAIRVALVSLPAVLFLLNRRRFAFGEREERLWRNFAIAGMASLVALLVVHSSTAVDRVTLYFLPLEIVILSRIPIAFRTPLLGRVAVIMASGAIEAVWLAFAVHAHYWLPYRFFPLGI